MHPLGYEEFARYSGFPCVGSSVLNPTHAPRGTWWPAGGSCDRTTAVSFVGSPAGVPVSTTDRPAASICSMASASCSPRTSGTVMVAAPPLTQRSCGSDVVGEDTVESLPPQAVTRSTQTTRAGSRVMRATTLMMPQPNPPCDRPTRRSSSQARNRRSAACASERLGLRITYTSGNGCRQPARSGDVARCADAPSVGRWCARLGEDGSGLPPRCCARRAARRARLDLPSTGLARTPPMTSSGIG